MAKERPAYIEEAVGYINLHAAIALIIDGKEHRHESVPDAVGHCRRYFMGGGRQECTIRQDNLVYTVSLSPDWDGTRLP